MAVGLMFSRFSKTILSFSVLERWSNSHGSYIFFCQLALSMVYAWHWKRKWTSDSISGSVSSGPHTWQNLLSSGTLGTEYLPVSIQSGRQPSRVFASNFRWLKVIAFLRYTDSGPNVLNSTNVLNFGSRLHSSCSCFACNTWNFS